MRRGWIGGIVLALTLLTAGLAEAWYPYPSHGYWPGPYPRSRFAFGFNFVIPVFPYPPAYYDPGYIAPPRYVPRCDTYTSPGYYRQVPWYTDPGGFTTFRQEWVPPTTTQVCR